MQLLRQREEDFIEQQIERSTDEENEEM